MEGYINRYTTKAHFNNVHKHTCLEFIFKTKVQSLNYKTKVLFKPGNNIHTVRSAEIKEIINYYVGTD